MNIPSPFAITKLAKKFDPTSFGEVIPFVGGIAIVDSDPRFNQSRDVFAILRASGYRATTSPSQDSEGYPMTCFHISAIR